MKHPKIKLEEMQQERRKCDCWLEVATCHCALDNPKSVRYSVRNQGDTYARFETLQQALSYGREAYLNGFDIYDNLENKIVLSYE